MTTLSVAVLEQDNAVAVTITALTSADRLRRRSVFGVETVPVPKPSGDMQFIDYAVPLNVPVTYYVARPGLNADLNAPPVTVPADVSWIHVAAFPTQRSRCVIERDESPSWENRGAVHLVIGRRDPLAVTDVMPYRAGTLVLYVATDYEYAELRDVLDTGDVLRVRPCTANVHPMTAFVERVTAERVLDQDSGPRRVRLQYRAVSEAPYVYAGSPDWTWTDVAEAFPSWDAVPKTFATWRELAEYDPTAASRSSGAPGVGS